MNKDLITTLTLNQLSSPREKPSYIGLEDNKDKLYTNVLADEFQKDIQHRVNAAIIQHSDKSRFPIGGECSLIINIYTRRTPSIFGILKNVMDAFNGVLYTDDCRVSSVIISRHDSREEYDTLSVTVSNSTIRDITVAAKSMAGRSIFDISITTILEGNYLPYPPSDAYTDILNTNVDDMNLQREIRSQYGRDVFKGQLAVSIELDSEASNGDIDNHAINYIVNMMGIVYEDVKQIEVLNIHRSARALNTTIKVYTVGATIH